LRKNHYFYKNIKTMEKVFKIVKKGEDDSNIKYWLTLTYEERLLNLEKIRQEVINRFYGTRQEFQRVYRIIERL
jgi:hypothetical protein